jgi:hypothetical protein
MLRQVLPVGVVYYVGTLISVTAWDVLFIVNTWSSLQSLL